MLQKILEYIKYPPYFLLWLDRKRVVNLDDELFLRLSYRKKFGRNLDLAKPKTFNEKLQWLKIHDRNPLYSELVDKYLVKEFIASNFGVEYIIPTLGIYDKFEDIDFNILPNKFVIKCTHDSGSVIVVKDKSKLDLPKARKQLAKCLRQDYSLLSREWPYKNVKPRIIIEEYIEDVDGKLDDYKFFVFNGKVQYIQVDYDRFTDHKRNIYSPDWEYQPFTIQYQTDPDHVIKKPKQLKQMINFAERIAREAGVPSFLRVDMYIIKNRIIFGEITFYHGAGYEIFTPSRYDRILGDMLELPIARKNEK